MRTLERRMLAVVVAVLLVSVWIVSSISHWLAFLVLLAVVGSFALLLRRRERLPSGAVATTRRLIGVLGAVPPIVFVAWLQGGLELAVVSGIGALVGLAGAVLVIRAVRPDPNETGP